MEKPVKLTGDLKQKEKRGKEERINYQEKNTNVCTTKKHTTAFYTGDRLSLSSTYLENYKEHNNKNLNKVSYSLVTSVKDDSIFSRYVPFVTCYSVCFVLGGNKSCGNSLETVHPKDGILTSTLYLYTV